jgi:transcriptional regulator with XRE-family HTH domain
MNPQRGLSTTIGKAARAARVRAELTQEDVAERMGLATEVYGRLERGGMLPSVPTLRKLCVVLRISADALLGLGPDHWGTQWGTPEPAPSKRAPEEPPEIRRLIRIVKKLAPEEFRLLSLLATGLRRLRELRPSRKRPGSSTHR